MHLAFDLTLAPRRRLRQSIGRLYATNAPPTPTTPGLISIVPHWVVSTVLSPGTSTVFPVNRNALPGPLQQRVKIAAKITVRSRLAKGAKDAIVPPGK